jgi:hypothetical protein
MLRTSVISTLVTSQIILLAFNADNSLNRIKCIIMGPLYIGKIP